jgi:hypothetical protein
VNENTIKLTVVRTGVCVCVYVQTKRDRLCEQEKERDLYSSNEFVVVDNIIMSFKDHRACISFRRIHMK